MSAPEQNSPMPFFGRVGLGCVTLGREINEAEACLLLDHAVARGVVHFDTAAAYGGGASEAILGRWLAGRNLQADGITVATKVLPPYEPSAIRASVERSLERLGLSAVDALYLHRWDESAMSLDGLAALHALVQEGRVRAIGVSNFTAARLAEGLRLQQREGLTPFQVVQNNHNVAVREVTPELAALCAAHGVRVVTYSPLGAGFLTGKHREGVQAGSRFELIPGHQDVYFHEEAWRRLAHLEAVARRTGHHQARLALAWAMRQPATDCVLVGGRTPAHLDQALSALDLHEPDLLAELGAD